MVESKGQENRVTGGGGAVRPSSTGVSTAISNTRFLWLFQEVTISWSLLLKRKPAVNNKGLYHNHQTFHQQSKQFLFRVHSSFTLPGPGTPTHCSVPRGWGTGLFLLSSLPSVQFRNLSPGTPLPELWPLLSFWLIWGHPSNGAMESFGLASWVRIIVSHLWWTTRAFVPGFLGSEIWVKLGLDFWSGFYLSFTLEDGWPRQKLRWDIGGHSHRQVHCKSTVHCSQMQPGNLYLQPTSDLTSNCYLHLYPDI